MHDIPPSASPARLLSFWNWTSNKKVLDESQRRFQKLIEQAPDAFFAHDLHGRFLQVNEQTCMQMGYSREEFLSMSVKDIQKGVAPEKAKHLWQKVLEGETVLAEDVLQRKDGSTFSAEVKISLFKTDDSIEIFGFFRDITERKRHEEEREALIARLQKALDEVKQLSGMLPICSNCKKIRDDEGYWNRLETYIESHSDIAFSHGICPGCCKILYPHIDV